MTAQNRLQELIGPDEEPERTMGPGMPSFQRDKLRRELRLKLPATAQQMLDDLLALLPEKATNAALDNVRTVLQRYFGVQNNV